MIARVLAKRRERSALYLSHYAESASRKLATSKGDLRHAERAVAVARVRSQLWPEASTATGADLSVQLDDKGKVRAIHARMIALLTGQPPASDDQAGA